MLLPTLSPLQCDWILRQAHELCASVLTGLKASIFALAIDYYTGDVAVAVGSEVHVAKEIGPSSVASAFNQLMHSPHTFARGICYSENLTCAS